MTRLRLCAQLACSLPVAVLAAALMAAPNAALAQQGSGFLDNLFNRGQQRPVQQAPAQQPEVAQAGASNPDDVNVRIDRIEQALRSARLAEMVVSQLRRRTDPGVERGEGGPAGPLLASPRRRPSVRTLEEFPDDTAS